MIAVAQCRIKIPEYRTQGEAAAQTLLVADVHTQPAVIQVTIVAVTEAAGPQHQALTQQRLVDREPGAAIVILAGLHCIAALELIHRLVVVDHDSARGGVAAKQGSLGAPQHLHPVHVHHGQRSTVDAADIAVVDYDGDAGLATDAKAVGADAPDCVNGCADTLLPTTQPGGQDGEILDALHTLVLQFLTIEHGDTDRHIGKGLLPVLGFYQDFLQRLGGSGDNKRRDTE